MIHIYNECHIKGAAQTFGDTVEAVTLNIKRMVRPSPPEVIQETGEIKSRSTPKVQWTTYKMHLKYENKKTGKASERNNFPHTDS